MAFVLYTMAEATQEFNEKTGGSYREETLRNRMKAVSLTIHKVGNIDLVAEDDLLRLISMRPPRRGRPPKSRK